MSAVALPALSDIQFVSADQLQPPPGVPTGVSTLDDFLLWKGIPKGDLSLFQGSPGTGATSLWVNMTQKAHEDNKWVAWVNGGTQLLPAHLTSRKINLKKLLVVKEPKEAEQLFWVLQELVTSSLFEVIGCELKEMFFKNHQLQKLKKLCRFHKVALVFVCHKVSKFVNPLFSLIIQFQRDFITIQRALHRPTPFTVAGSMVYANFVHQFKNTARKLLS
ncbi:recA protein [Bdellovibrio sp. ZAP7]|uniref:recA protein n=1 Tax=Bdellovibrio sp. ZAP7 TaxID=2231053 RepID=UPI0011586089|nr:recA protein [Bdellovibrio sp. ZAP7]QDK43990.1 recA protein [Bdellovibrio sp. ZAP7]